MDFNQLGQWYPLLAPEFSKPTWGELCGNVDKSRKLSTVYPPPGQVFRGFSLTQPHQVRVVILGQDPYHGPGQANGLAFSVKENQPLLPSLRNIFQEISADLGVSPPPNGDLTFWAEQGVLLLNPVLTVSAGQPNSHKSFGWQKFTDAVLLEIGKFPQPIAFVLWGASAQKKEKVIAKSNHPRLIIKSVHPSPLSAYRGFFGSKPFSQINQFLADHGERPIAWTR